MKKPPPPQSPTDFDGVPFPNGFELRLPPWMSKRSDSALLGIQAGRRNSQPFWNGTRSKLTGLIQGRAYLARPSLYGVELKTRLTVTVWRQSTLSAAVALPPVRKRPVDVVSAPVVTGWSHGAGRYQSRRVLCAERGPVARLATQTLNISTLGAEV